MRDGFCREINYLRVSLTDSCNLRCLYCLPDGCQTALHNDSLLSREDYLRLVPLITSTGITKIRLTGGEPLLYPHLKELISAFKKLKGIEKIALTTNGILLADKIAELAASGLNEINISLDALEPKVFSRLTRGGKLDKVLAGIKRCLRLNIPIKLNSVILQQVNDDQIIPLVQFAQDNGIPLRFIELMPFGAAEGRRGMDETALKNVLRGHFGSLQPLEAADRSSPAHYYLADKLTVPVGFISTLSHNFCSSCARIRLTSRGILRPCLLENSGTDLKQMINKGCCDEEIISAVKKCILSKPPCHNLAQHKNFGEECKSMSQIGG